MNAIHYETTAERLKAIVSAITISSATKFSFAGQNIDANVTRQAAPGMQAAQENPAVTALRDCLYTNCYCKPFPARTVPTVPAAPLPPRDLTAELSAANAGQPRWDTGWQIARMEASGQVIAQKAGKTRSLWPGEFLTFDGPGVPPRPGSHISVYFPHESRTMQPGFYFAFSEAESEPADETRLTRFYWNLREDGAVPLTNWLTQTLNRFQVPFRYKCLTVSGQFERLDAAVLYVSKRFFRISTELVAGGLEKLNAFLRPETPLFTRELAPGLAFAEDPGNGESFGMNRCRILSEAIWSAASKGLAREEERMQEVLRYFGQYGLSFERIHLNAQSADFYDTPEFAQ
jgi:hypothetical protein